MVIEEELPKIKTRSRGKISPWITTILMLIYTVVVQVMIVTSMEEAFSFMEEFLEGMAFASTWSIALPIPLIAAMLFYYYGRQDKETNLNLFIFSATALGIMLIGIALYYIIDPFQYFPSSRTNFVYFTSFATASIVIGIASSITKVIVVKRKSL